MGLPDRIQKTAVLVPFGNRDADLVAGKFLDMAGLFAGDGEVGLLDLGPGDAIDRLLVARRRDRVCLARPWLGTGWASRRAVSFDHLRVNSCACRTGGASWAGSCTVYRRYAINCGRA